MNKISFATLALVMVMTLAGCSARATSMIEAVSSDTSSTEAALPLATRLVVGTFRLEGTDQAVAAEQAEELLPLWKAYRSMSSSTSSSQIEMQALVEQVRSMMTEEQLATITTMALTVDDMNTVMEEQGVSATATAQEAGASTSASSASKSQSAPGGGGPTGGLEGGAPPEEGGIGGVEMPSASASSGARGSGVAQSNGSNAMVSTALLDALVNMLAAKA